MSSIVVSDLAYSPPGAEQLFFDVSFTVSPGEHAVIVGANGTGKSTILRALQFLHVAYKLGAVAGVADRSFD